MTEQFEAISSEQIIKINGVVTNQAGLLINDNVEACFSSIDYYNDIEEKIASIIRGLSKNHYFTDGNKRTAYAVFEYLCYANGLKFPNKNWAHLFLKISSNNYSVEEIVKLLF